MYLKREWKGNVEISTVCHFIVSLRNAAVAACSGGCRLVVRGRSKEDTLCNGKLDNLYSSTGIIRMRWAGCVVRMKQTRDRYRVVSSVESYRRK